MLLFDLSMLETGHAEIGTYDSRPDVKILLTYIVFVFLLFVGKTQLPRSIKRTFKHMHYFILTCTGYIIRKDMCSHTQAII